MMNRDHKWEMRIAEYLKTGIRPPAGDGTVPRSLRWIHSPADFRAELIARNRHQRDVLGGMLPDWSHCAKILSPDHPARVDVQAVHVMGQRLEETTREVLQLLDADGVLPIDLLRSAATWQVALVCLLYEGLGRVLDRIGRLDPARPEVPDLAVAFEPCERVISDLIAANEVAWCALAAVDPDRLSGLGVGADPTVVVGRGRAQA